MMFLFSCVVTGHFRLLWMSVCIHILNCPTPLSGDTSHKLQTTALDTLWFPSISQNGRIVEKPSDLLGLIGFH